MEVYYLDIFNLKFWRVILLKTSPVKKGVDNQTKTIQNKPPLYQNELSYTGFKFIIMLHFPFETIYTKR